MKTVLEKSVAQTVGELKNKEKGNNERDRRASGLRCVHAQKERHANFM